MVTRINTGKNIRGALNQVNSKFEEELQKFVPKPGVAELYKEVVCDVYSEDKLFFQAEKSKVITLITDQNNRITKLRELLLTDSIEPSEYKIIKTECDEKISRLEAKLKELTNQLSSEINIRSLVDKAVINLTNLVYIYREADISEKQYIIGSIFLEKWVYDGSQGRTGQINEAALLMYQISNELGHKKTGVKTNFRDYSGKVPRAGVEPAQP